MEKNINDQKANISNPLASASQQDTAYIDPNSQEIKDSVKPINYQPNKKISIILLALFLITAIVGILITNRNAQRYQESIKPQNLLLPSSSHKN